MFVFALAGCQQFSQALRYPHAIPFPKTRSDAGNCCSTIVACVRYLLALPVVPPPPPSSIPQGMRVHLATTRLFRCQLPAGRHVTPTTATEFPSICNRTRSPWWVKLLHASLQSVDKLSIAAGCGHAPPIGCLGVVSVGWPWPCSTGRLR